MVFELTFTILLYFVFVFQSLPFPFLFFSILVWHYAIHTALHFHPYRNRVRVSHQVLKEAGQSRFLVSSVIVTLALCLYTRQWSPDLFVPYPQLYWIYQHKVQFYLFFVLFQLTTAIPTPQCVHIMYVLATQTVCFLKREKKIVIMLKRMCPASLFRVAWLVRKFFVWSPKCVNTTYNILSLLPTM